MKMARVQSRGAGGYRVGVCLSVPIDYVFLIAFINANSISISLSRLHGSCCTCSRMSLNYLPSPPY